MSTRLFIAIDLPAQVTRRLARLVANPPAGVRAVRSQQTHLTLHFLGAVDDQALAGLAGDLAGVKAAPFTVDIVGTGVFPPRGRPTVLWAGVHGSDVLLALHDAIARVLEHRGFEPERRHYVPHVTLARLGRGVPRGWTDRFLAETRGLSLGPIPVTAFQLYASVHTDTGPVHTVVASCPLADRA